MSTINSNAEVEPIPWTRSEKNQITFRALTENMNSGNITDTPKGSILYTEKISNEDWNSELQPNKYGYVISENKRIHKDILSYDPETKTAICQSRNKSLKEITFSISIKTAEIYKVIKRAY